MFYNIYTYARDARDFFFYEKNNDFPCSYLFLYELLFYHLDVHGGLRCYVFQMAKAI